MACGCVDTCNCFIQGANGNTVTGSGSAGSPYVITAPNETLFSAANTDGTISIIPGGISGHSPIFNLNLDPASTAPVSTGVDGLRIDCCSEGGSIASATDTFSIDHTVTLGNLTSDLRLRPSSGLSTTVGGVGIVVDPASTAPVTLSATGLRVDCCSATISDPAMEVNQATFTKATYPLGRYVLVRVVGGGGGGGGAAATAAGTVASAGGGGGGGYAEALISFTALPAVTAITVGAAGAGGAAGANPGSAGTSSTFGGFCTATGGGGGAGGAASAGPLFIAGGTAGGGTVGDILVSGEEGGLGSIINTAGGGRVPTNNGGGTTMGEGGQGTIDVANAGRARGGGGSGAANANSAAARAGAAGSSGLVIVEVI